MTKYLVLSIFFLLSIKNYSQEILFKVAYLPNKQYSQSMQQTSRSVITYLGPDELLKKIEEKKLENPKVTLNKLYLKNINTTGDKKEGQFPITIEFIAGEKSIVPNGTTVFGHVIENKTPTLDSIYAPEMDSIFKKAFFLSMQNVVSQINFPEEKIKLGKSFKREMPISIPIGNFTFHLKNNITYTLKKIENKKAFFDIVQTYTMKAKESNMSLKASGSGSGKIIYDIENTFFLLYELDSTLNMQVANDDVKFDVQSKDRTMQTFAISSN